MRIHFVVRATAAGLTAIALLSTAAAGAPASSAADTVPTKIVLTVSPNTVSYPDPEVTVTGTLETAGSDPQGVADQAVQLNYRFGPNLEFLGTVTTSADGTFTWSQAIPVPGSFTAEFAGGDGYAPTGEQTWPQPAQQFPARILLSQSRPAAYLSNTAVNGELQMQLPGGAWVPSPYAEVAWSQSNPQSCQPNGAHPAFITAYTDADGDFSLPIQANPGTDQCAIVTPGTNGEYEWSATAPPAPVLVPLIADPTEFVNVSAPSRAPVSAITFSARVAYLTASDLEPDYTGPVELEFRAPDSGTWTLMATVKPAGGRANFKVSGYLKRGGIAAGNWRLVIAPSSASYLGSSTTSIPVHVTVPTRISARTRRRALSGMLRYLPHGRAIRGAAVAIEKLSHGRWHAVAVIRTNSHGNYECRLRGPGTYRAAFARSRLPGAQSGFGTFSASASPSVRVR